MRSTLIAVSLAALACCAGPRSTDSVVLLLHDGATHALSANTIRYEPASSVISARLSAQGWLAIERRSAAPLTVRIPEFCPVDVPAGPQHKAIALRPVLDLGADPAPVGFDASFSVVALHGCPERGKGEISWRQIEGAPLGELTVSDAGFRLSARTARFETVHPDSLGDGIVPISPRTQGRAVLEATWHAPGFAPIRRSITIRATSRATGLSSVSVTQQLLLAGAGWHVQHAPPNGHAQVQEHGAFSQFTPDAPGRWAIEREGRTLGLQALWHDKTPYDCGRSGCHTEIATSSSASPMSHALERQLNAAKPAAVGCMLECHVLGESGLQDGGFLAVAADAAPLWLDTTDWQQLPRPLRRLGGVRCTACHGPGAIPEPEAREHVLRSDVCATCHDAPPRYVHVAQWRASRMARSDVNAATRTGRCASCHTTRGFLEELGVRAPSKSDVQPEAFGIACAACHSPHASHSAARLIRDVPEPGPHAGTLEPSTRLCLGCHAPRLDEPQPSASAGALWLGSARVPAAGSDTWQLASSASAHRQIPGGCTGCHGAVGSGTAIDHSFRAQPSTCKGCHAGATPEERVQAGHATLQARATALAERIERLCPQATEDTTAMPPHAATQAACATQPLRRALYELDMVREDPAAAVHNAAFARSLLDDAERQLH